MGELPFITARPAWELVDWAAQQGCASRELLEVVELDSALLQNPDAQIPLARFYDLLEAIAARAGGGFGLRFCLAVDPVRWEAANVLLTASATVGEGVQRMIHYLPLWNGGEQIRLERRAGEASLLYTPFGRGRPAHAIKAEMTFADFTMGARRMCGASLESPLRVCFRHRRPRSLELHTRIFGETIEFGAERDELVFHPGLLDRPLATANPQALQFLERRLEAQLQRRPQRLIDRLRVALVEALPRDPSVQAVARLLGMGPRTLQRQLRAEGTSYQRELESERKTLARRHLDEKLPIAEAAYLVGFSEPSAFHRAFRRWTGMTPQEYQRRSNAN